MICHIFYFVIDVKLVIVNNKDVELMYDIRKRKTALSRSILNHFNDAFQFVVSSYGEGKLKRLATTNSNRFKVNFKRQFYQLAQIIKSVTGDINNHQKQINPYGYIKKIAWLIGKYQSYPDSRYRFFCHPKSEQARFRCLFESSVVNYYRDLILMIRYTCDDYDSDVDLTDQEVAALFHYFTNDDADLYRDHVMGDLTLQVTFQRRETALSRNDTITHLGELKPLIVCN